MHRGFPSRHYFSASSSGGSGGGGSSNSSGDSDYSHLLSSRLGSMVAENAIIVFARRGCCMCHVVQRLLFGLGVNPTIYAFDEDDEAALIHGLLRIVAFAGDDAVELPEFPAVFIGGKLFGGLEKLMAAHISGDLVPLLRKAGALWL
ncbi:PREDICTED: glutaredoxin-C9-like [Ipomoea nil]|uniref:glutaredoxin-C9-like n=1 Tax=Ipomoea nil TaxID=35883 RepID=UPI00090145F3|nr:PREDICTED: glutaredoxin-C9-like [Ipomoea nil]